MSFDSNKNKNWILKTESVIEDSLNKWDLYKGL